MKALYPALVLAALSAIAQAAASEKTCTLPKNRAAHQVGCLQDGLAAYSEKGRYGYVDENGEISSPCNTMSQLPLPTAWLLSANGVMSA